MKIRAVTLVEVILFILFTTGYFLYGRHVPFSRTGTLSALSALIILYWLPLSPLKAYSINSGVSIGLAAVLSIDLVSIISGQYRWPFASLYLLIALVLDVIVMIVASVSYLSKQRSGLPVKINKGFMTRFFAYFIFVLYTYLTH